MELREKHAVITGAGSGIGRAMALRLASERCRVSCWGRRLDSLEETVAAIEKAGGKAAAFSVDVTSQKAIEEAAAQTVEKFGGVDILVNNAGRFASLGAAWEVDPDSWWKDVTVNLRGTMLCTRGVVPGMIERDSGIVVNLSGGGVEGPMKGGSGYGCSKTAIVRFTDTVAGELGKTCPGVFMFALDPGFNRTAMTEQLGALPGADKWMPNINKHFETNDYSEPADAAETLVQIIQHACWQLNGRLIHVKEDVAGFVLRKDEILSQDALVLRFRKMADSPANEQ